MSSPIYSTVLYEAIKEATTNLGYDVVDSDGPQQIGMWLLLNALKVSKG